MREPEDMHKINIAPTGSLAMQYYQYSKYGLWHFCRSFFIAVSKD